MKRFHISIVALLITCGISTSSIAQKNIKSQFVMPIFNSGNIIVKSLLNDPGISKLYLLLDSLNDYKSYEYGFKISTEGKVISTNIGSDLVLNNFIESCFNKYKWTPAYMKNCPKYKKVAYGTIYINLVPTKNFIQISVNVNDGVVGKHINNRIVFDRMIKFQNNSFLPKLNDKPL